MNAPGVAKLNFFSGGKQKSLRKDVEKKKKKKKKEKKEITNNAISK